MIAFAGTQNHGNSFYVSQSEVQIGQNAKGDNGRAVPGRTSNAFALVIPTPLSPSETRSLIDSAPLERQPGVWVRRGRLAGRFIETGWGRVLVERLGRGLSSARWLLPVDSWRSQSSTTAAQSALVLVAAAGVLA